MGAGHAAERMRGLADLSYGTAKGVEQRRESQENTLSLLRNKIGAPGTYDTPSETTSAPPSSTAPVAGGLFKTVANSTSGLVGTTSQGTHTELDPEAAANTLSQSSAFRQTSRMMAESEQLLARSGPLYDEMIRNTQLPIIEGSATAARENTEALRKAMSRGGAARRDAFDAIQKIRAQDQLNMQRGQALADAHMKLDTWTRDNAKNVINFADSWSANQAGVRDSFHSAMDQAAELMSAQAIPMMYTTINKAQEIRDQQSAARRSKVNNWIKGTVGLVVGAVGAFYGGSGAAMNSFGDMSGKEQAAATNSSYGSQPTGSNNYFGIGGQE